jgi:2-oxo-4-hydroxy-4-carboxy-5-ureidoimidazoline decarboxylase
MSSLYTLAELNQFSQADFVRVVGPLFEHSPWVAEGVAVQRPFRSSDHLSLTLETVMWTAPEVLQLDLIRAHPDLASKAALEGKLTASSNAEQSSAGLNRLSPDEFEKFHRLNTAYREKFGFPFIICVRLHTKESILAAFETRIAHTAAEEKITALEQIALIGRLRLGSLLLPASPKLSTHVLDTQNGKPAPGLKLTLFRIEGESRTQLVTTATNADGRTDRPLLAGNEVVVGTYEIIFEVGAYFGSATFLDHVPLRFVISDATQSYHVPLLCSPWAYSTYRGS